VVHPHTAVGTQHAVDVHPAGTELQELPHIVRLKQIGTIELFVVGAMTAFHPTIVAFTPQRVAPQGSPQRHQEALAQFLHVAGIVTPKLLPPVGLEGHRCLHPKGT
jgi:hypothetical protein